MPITLNAADNCGGTLASAASSGSTSLSVNLAAGSTAFPTAPFRLGLWGADGADVVLSYTDPSGTPNDVITATLMRVG